MRINKKIINKIVIGIIYHSRYMGSEDAMGIPGFLFDDPRTEIGATWKLRYRELKAHRRKSPEKQWRITGVGLTSWITDSPK